MWTKKSIKKFIKDNSINTNGALKKYKSSKIKTIEDGDINHIVKFPIWHGMNDSVTKGVLNLTLNAFYEGDVRILPYQEEKGDRGISIEFCEHACNPS